MSEIMQEFLAALQPRVTGVLKGSAKLVITGEGSVMMDETGARAGDGAADVTLKISEQVFRAIMDGSQNPVMAVMSGKLKVDGSATRALKIGQILTGA
jgi:putative sterol carrier protein